MIRVQSSVVLKFIDPLDRFARIRKFEATDVGNLLHIQRPLGKEEYYHLVLSACLVDYVKDTQPSGEVSLARQKLLIEALYQASIECNPGLDIHKVVLPVGDAAEGKSEIHLLERDGQTAETSGRALRKLPIQGLEDRLKSHVVGQDEPIRLVVRALRSAAAGLRRAEKPIGSFLFVGQTGVGKTELARAISRALWGDLGHMLRIDCSEYALRHEYSKLIGAPPGYVGYGEGGLLTDGMRRLRQAIVVFDEIEKADPQVHNLLLHLLEEGVVHDGKGESVPFDQALVVLTSNVGVERVDGLSNRIGFSEMDPGQRERFTETFSALKDVFRPEFINRLDEVVLFNPLELGDCVRIVGLILGEVAGALQAQEIGLEYTPPACRHLAESGHSPEYGARELRRVVQRSVEEPLADMILAGKVGPGRSVRLRVRSGRLGFEVN